MAVSGEKACSCDAGLRPQPRPPLLTRGLSPSPGPAGCCCCRCRLPSSCVAQDVLGSLPHAFCVL